MPVSGQSIGNSSRVRNYSTAAALSQPTCVYLLNDMFTYGLCLECKSKNKSLAASLDNATICVKRQLTAASDDWTAQTVNCARVVGRPGRTDSG